MTGPAFPDAAGETAWRAAVGKVLKGGDLESRLVRHTDDGIRVEPLYPPADAPASTDRRSPCTVMARIDHPDPDEANRAALDDLENGADGLVVVLAGAPSARGFGLDPSGVERALAGIEIDRVPLRLEPAPFAGLDAVRAMLDVAGSLGIEPATLRIDAGLDPLGWVACGSAPPEPWPALTRLIADVVDALRGSGLSGALLRADGRLHHEAGASEAQELAAVLSTAVTYLRVFEGAGVPLDTARKTLSFLLAAGADDILTIAKVRALRRLWALVEEVCSLDPEPVSLHAETAWRMMARRDPHTNLLRGTLACVGAMLGGADGVTVLPFTAALGLADPFARRLARNTALVLRDEAGLDRVADPAAGSGAVEALTEALCREAWAQFQALERGGGLASAVADGSWAARIATTRERRRSDLRDGRRTIVGTTAYRPAADAPVTILMPMPVAAAATGALPSLRDDELIEPDGVAAGGSP